MIPLSVPQKQLVNHFFEEDIKLVKKYFNAIGFDFDEEFKFDIFKEFIYAAAGMFKSLDMAIYNQELVTKFKTIRLLTQSFNDFEQKSRFAATVYNQIFLQAQENYVTKKSQFDTLKASLQMLITMEKGLTAQRQQMEEQLKNVPASEHDVFEFTLKKVRREQVDAIHTIGTQKQELDECFNVLKAFEDEHRDQFIKSFNETREKLIFQYTRALDFFGFEFNEALFRNSEKSDAIQKFKREAAIEGPMNLCKYVEYYLRNVVPETLADAGHKERLLDAKRYCERVNKK